jgi:hypothetical protein
MWNIYLYFIILKLFTNFQNIIVLVKIDAQALVSFKKIYAPSSSLLQGKHLPFSLSPLRFNIFRLFVILLLTQLYRYTPEIFLFSTVTFKYTYGDPLRRIGQDYLANVAWWKFKSLKRIQPLPVCAGFFICIRNSLKPTMCNNAIMIISSQM